MYYSATHDACHDPERGHCLAIATAKDPEGPFIDMGVPLLLIGAVNAYVLRPRLVTATLARPFNPRVLSP